MRLLEALFLSSVFYAVSNVLLYVQIPGMATTVFASAEHTLTCSAGIGQCRPPSSSSSSSSTTSSRFPLYGTKEYANLCPWVGSPDDSAPAKDCSILLRPDPIRNNEGVSWWATEAAYSFIMSQLTGCRLLLDYMPDVKIEDVLVQPRGLAKPDGTATWAASSDYNCTASRRCYLVDRPNCKDEARIVEMREEMSQLGDGIGRELVRIPQYRFGYFSQISVMTKWKLYEEDYQQLAKAMPNFDLQGGHSCALASLFELNEGRAELYQPDLFTHILPTLRDENNLVITLYYRSNYADSRARAEKEGKDFVEETKNVKKAVGKVIDCVLGREEEFLSKRREDEMGRRTRTYKDERIADFESIVWMVVSDSVTVKEWIADEYNGNNTNARIEPAQQRYPGRVIPRAVLTTTSRGIHTRAKRKTSTADFAEAVIDWYLIGESDVVVSSGSMSFGETAALRTQRPTYLFQNNKCSRFDLILPPRDNATLNEEKENAKKPKIWIPQ